MNEIVETSEETSIDNQIENTGEYHQDILIDKRKLKMIQKEKFSLTNFSGFNVNILEKLGFKTRKHNLFYGINIQERALEASMTSNQVMIPLLSRRDLQNKLNNIKPEIRNMLGWVHIGAIQILINQPLKKD